uniref:Circadian clock-controlled protein n=2 Tax=Lygus hesperus TaxID=30085 RepID=A0A0A9Y8B6_LYGHE
MGLKSEPKNGSTMTSRQRDESKPQSSSHPRRNQTSGRHSRKRHESEAMSLIWRSGCAVLLLLCLSSGVAPQDQETPYFLHPCHKVDPNLNQCLTYAANHLASHMRKGIPELEIGDVEPIVIDEINLALGSGPDGYRATFKDIRAFGVSNLTVTGIRSDIETLQFQLTFFIPRIQVRANYRSSGVLIMVQATGGGDYWGKYEGVKAKTYIRASKQDIDGTTYLILEDLKMDFSVKDIQMGIENVHNGNAVIEAALNLFINSHSQELLREMKPTIKKKLISTMHDFVDNLFARIPYDLWIME